MVAMVCPNCGKDMVPGAAILRSTPWVALSFGPAWQRLFFRPQGARERDEIEIMNPNQRKLSFRCAACEAMFILPAPTDPAYA
jgi:hypothetical protein